MYCFVQYLNIAKRIYLSENGRKGITLFQPLSNQQSALSNEWKAKFEDGMNKKMRKLDGEKFGLQQMKKTKLLDTLIWFSQSVKSRA